MPSRLRQLQQEWNALVPQAQARGLRNVREVALYPTGLHERITHRTARLEWLRRELGLTSALVSPATAVGTGEFTFGCELEFRHVGYTRDQVVDALVNAGVNTRFMAWRAHHNNHGARRSWTMTTDGSLNDYANSSELVSPVLTGEAGLAELAKACQALTNLGCTVNKSCGLHVHIGVRNENVDFFRNLVLLHNSAEPLIDTVLAPSRRGTTMYWCRSLVINHDRMLAANTVEQVVQAAGQSRVQQDTRYRKLNLLPFWLHGTVEFRQHQGTIDADKACNWVRFCIRMCLAARKGAPLSEHTLTSLLSILDTPEGETQWWVDRHNHFATLAGSYETPGP